MTDVAAPAMSDRNVVAQAAGIWWVFLCTGLLWLLFAIIVFRFDWTTVHSISILFGVVLLAAAVMELLAAFADHGWWRVAQLLLALAFGVIGIVAFIHPGNTFKALAAVISFYFIVKGFFHDAVSLFAWRDMDHAWLVLVLGLAELVVGFWAAGDFGNQVILLVVWVGITALTRGISEIILAFRLRSVRV